MTEIRPQHTVGVRVDSDREGDEVTRQLKTDIIFMKGAGGPMIVCLCEGLNDQRIEGAIRAGCRSVQDLARRTGAGSQCGACGCELKRMLAEHRAKMQAEAEAAMDELSLAAK